MLAHLLVRIRSARTSQCETCCAENFGTTANVSS
jgi:hypothetical protein